MEIWLDWLKDLEWNRLIPELLGKGLGVLAGIAISWWVLFRKRLRYLDRLRRGDTDDLLFQAHYLLPLDDGRFQLIFRNVAPRRTIDEAYDNPIARDALRELGRATTLNAPIVSTSGRVGFDILNDAVSILSGWLATSSMPRKVWLFCMTCEDRELVRRTCIRCFLFQQDDLQRFADWQWCRQSVCVEKPWHWVRVVTLHRIACFQHDEELSLPKVQQETAPLIDDQRKHRRIISLSLGINDQEVAVGQPIEINWDEKQPELEKRGIVLQR